jgi:hypothetical protein
MVLCDHHITAAELTLTLRAFLGKDVALMGIATLVFTAGGGAETLGRGTVSLYLRHCRNSLVAFSLSLAPLARRFLSAKRWNNRVFHFLFKPSQGLFSLR